MKLQTLIIRSCQCEVDVCVHALEVLLLLGNIEFKLAPVLLKLSLDTRE